MIITVLNYIVYLRKMSYYAHTDYYYYVDDIYLMY